jgi:hypothetical protein
LHFTVIEAKNYAPALLSNVLSSVSIPLNWMRFTLDFFLVLDTAMQSAKPRCVPSNRRMSV